MFIASLLDEATASGTHEIQGMRSALVTAVESDSLRDEDEAYVRKLMDAGIAVAAIRYDGRAVRVDCAVMDAFGGDAFKAK
jgi:acetyl esterase